MRVDVSEIKTYRTCKRQWQLTSRNKFHLRPMITPPAFATGTLFHEGLASLYLGSPLEKTMEFVRKEMRSETDTCLLAMIPGYYKNVLFDDLDRFDVLDIEHKFSIPIPELDIEICGSIDMIVRERATNKIFGFEHKTAKNFRDSSFLWMDEQPRVYTVALLQYIDKLNSDETSAEWKAKHTCDPQVPYTLGGIYINEVKKLLKYFQYRRTLCKYPEDDLTNFFNAFVDTCAACHKDADSDSFMKPSPGYFTCSMCDYRTICETYMYSTLDKKAILDEFNEEFVERETDHLDDKVERVKE